MRCFSLVLSLCFVSLLVAEEPTVLREESELVEGLDQDSLQKAIRTLLESYIKRDSLDSLELNRAAMQGLLDRSGIGVTLVDRRSETVEPIGRYKLVAEVLSGSVAYLRPGTFSVSEVSEIAEHLDRFGKTKLNTLILDLRVPAKDASFKDAARLLNHFCPPNEVLFKIRKPGEAEPTVFESKPATEWGGELIVLIDHQTAPAAEAIAKVLKQLRDPVIVGSRTSGKTVKYDRVPISADAALRFAVADLVFADESSIFKTGVQPDLEIAFEVADKAYIFHASQSLGMKPFVFSKRQPRHNEAALVAGTNPELDYAIAKGAGKDTGFDAVPIHDRVVQAAMDYLVTREVYE